MQGFVLVLLVCLGACAGDSTEGDGTTGEAPSTERSAETGEQMPDAVLGTYDVDQQACAEIVTMNRLVISPDTLDFYYGYATVDGVAARDGGFDVSATLFHTEGAIEVVPEPTTYRIAPTEGGLRLDGEGEVPPLSLVRCASGPAPQADGDVRNQYTEISDCTTIETFEESGGTVQRCPGVEGTPLFVSEGDLRYDVDAGVRDDTFETPEGFNSLGKTVEWRLRDGRPFAVIVRYEIEGPSGTAAERRSDLAVIKVGREGAPGCLVGYVPADATPDQNTAARRLADREAAGFDCGS